jgi:hypothetical protein
METFDASLSDKGNKFIALRQKIQKNRPDEHYPVISTIMPFCNEIWLGFFPVWNLFESSFLTIILKAK